MASYLAKTLNYFVNTEGSARSNGYDWTTTAEDIIAKEKPDLSGKNVLVTGSNSGIGKETAYVLAGAGATVYMACLSTEKAEEAVADLQQRSKGEGKGTLKLKVMVLDLSSLKSVREFAAKFKVLNLPLHVLICNAGIMGCPYEETADGFEMQFGTNYLGHFLLVNLLLDCLKEAQPARVVILSSSAHRIGGARIRFDDLKGKDTWYSGRGGPSYAYGQSKTANILFALELARRMKEQGLKITANALHPGAIKTDLQRYITGLTGLLVDVIGFLTWKTVQQGAATSVFLAVSPLAEGVSGKYFSDCNVATPAGPAADAEQAARLWEVSEKLVGLA